MEFSILFRLFASPFTFRHSLNHDCDTYLALGLDLQRRQLVYDDNRVEVIFFAQPGLSINNRLFVKDVAGDYCCLYFFFFFFCRKKVFIKKSPVNDDESLAFL